MYSPWRRQPLVNGERAEEAPKGQGRREGQGGIDYRDEDMSGQLLGKREQPESSEQKAPSRHRRMLARLGGKFERWWRVASNGQQARGKGSWAGDRVSPGLRGPAGSSSAWRSSRRDGSGRDERLRRAPPTS